jgi:hypothetical protein
MAIPSRCCDRCCDRCCYRSCDCDCSRTCACRPSSSWWMHENVLCSLSIREKQDDAPNLFPLCLIDAKVLSCSVLSVRAPCLLASLNICFDEIIIPIIPILTYCWTFGNSQKRFVVNENERILRRPNNKGPSLSGSFAPVRLVLVVSKLVMFCSFVKLTPYYSSAGLHCLVGGCDIVFYTKLDMNIYFNCLRDRKNFGLSCRGKRQ